MHGASPAAISAAGSVTQTDAAGLSAAESDPPGTADSVDSLVALGLRTAPTLEALRERILAARQMARAAGASMDPMAGFTLTGMNSPGGQIGEDPMSVAAFELSQSFAVPGKLRSRREAALAESHVVEAQLAAARRDLAAEIEAGYAQLYAMDRETTVLHSTGGLLDFLSSSAAARYATGEGDLSEPARMQLERTRLAERLDDLVVERAESAARLNALLDRPGTVPVRTTATLPDPPAALLSDEVISDDLVEQALEHSAEVRMSRAEAAVAERKVRAARLARWPDFTVGGEYGYRDRLDPMVTVRLGVELPVWKGGKQDAELRAAEHELRAAQADLRAVQARVRAEAGAMLLRLSTADRQVRRYREEILPRSALIADAKRTAYTTGRGGAGELIEALRMRLMAESETARREADRFELWARWRAMAGPEADAMPGTESMRGADDGLEER